MKPNNVSPHLNSSLYFGDSAFNTRQRGTLAADDPMDGNGQDFPDSSGQGLGPDQETSLRIEYRSTQSFESYPSRGGSSDDGADEFLREVRDFLPAENLRYRYPNLRSATVNPAQECQSLRQINTVRSFLQSVERDEHVANLASYHYEQYQMYARYMDSAEQEDGMVHHMDTVCSRFSDARGKERNEEWLRDQPLPRARMLTNTDIIETLHPMNDFCDRYQIPIVDAYEGYAPILSSSKEPTPEKIALPSQATTPSQGRPTTQSASTKNGLQNIVERITAEPEKKTVAPRSTRNVEPQRQRASEPESKPKNKPRIVAAPPPQIVSASEKMMADIEKGKADPGTNDLLKRAYEVLAQGKRKEPTDRPAQPSKIKSPVKDNNGYSTGRPADPLAEMSRLVSKNINRELLEIILENVMDLSTGLSLDDVVGQENAKEALDEAVVMPALNPELFTGLTAPVRGVLLYGPPGNGKTMLAKAVAATCNQTFFNVSASTLASKFVGEGEKLVRALFEVARAKQPSIIFIDEIDSILTSRKESDHDSSRKMKTEFLLQFEGLSTAKDERVLVIGATNLPQELDAAALRRFPKRILIPLPDEPTRNAMLRKLLDAERHDLSQENFEALVKSTDGYSGSDMSQLAKQAAMQRVREFSRDKLSKAKKEEMRPISAKDFASALLKIKPSTDKSTLQAVENWSKTHGDNG